MRRNETKLARKSEMAEKRFVDRIKMSPLNPSLQLFVIQLIQYNNINIIIVNAIDTIKID